MSQQITTIVYDLGGVLIDWSPRYLYRNIFQTEKEMEWFLEHVCTMDWNEQQDAGRSWAEAIAKKTVEYPAFEVEISAYFDRWTEMLNGSITKSVELFEELRNAEKYQFYALTNWSAETFPHALERYDFLQWFEGILVSGQEKMRKPFPEIYQLLFDRYKINPAEAIFIDDNKRNIEAAEKLGMKGIHFEGPQMAKAQLKSMGIYE